MCVFSFLCIEEFSLWMIGHGRFSHLYQGEEFVTVSTETIQEKENKMKVTMYGAPICPDCVVAKEQLANKEDVEVTYRDITAETAIMKEFLAYRDHEPCFEPIRKEGKIGIPFFILEDGTKTFDVAEHIEVDETIVRVGQVCSIDGKNC